MNKLYHFFCCFYSLFWLVSTLTFAQDATIFRPDSIRKTVTAQEITRNLKIDGRLDETEWQQAAATGEFIEIDPYQGEKAKHNTQVRMLFNKSYLYIAAFCEDTLGKKSIRATDFRRDFNFRGHDLFGITIDGFNDRRNAMSLMTNPYGTQRDLLSFDDLLYDVDWDGLWRVRTARTDSGWVAELAVPWQTLRYLKTADAEQSWGINFFRNRRMTNERMAWARHPRAFTALRMEYAGTLKGIKPPPPSPNIRVQPYLLTQWSRLRANGTTDTPAPDVKLGGEVKWALNPNSVLDLTFNTDFAQADADRFVNNVTRFSVFFPERRQFFLENASLFSPGLAQSDDFSGGSMRIQPFFSRTIGLDAAGNPIPIDAGARYVHRSLKSNYGGLLMRQRQVGNSPATWFGVGRYSKNFGTQNRIGGLLTVKSENELPNRPGQTNVLGAIDAFVRFDEAHSLSTMAMQSSNNDGSGQGFAGFAKYQYATNQWKLWWTQSVVTKNFDPKLGFVARTDVIATTPGAFWYYRGKYLPFKKLIRAFEPSLFLEWYHQASTGRLIERTVGLNPIWVNFQNGSFIGLIITPTFQRLTEVFAPLGVRISEGEYRYTRWAVWASTDVSKKLSARANWETGKYFNGSLMTTDLSVQFAPMPHISLTGRYNSNRFKEVGDARTTTNIDLYALETRLALNPRVQLIGIYQRNTQDRRDLWNVRLAWEFQPLSFLYVVYNNRAFTTLNDRRQEQFVIAKLSYLKQF